jgi:hypothetical protein
LLVFPGLQYGTIAQGKAQCVSCRSLWQLSSSHEGAGSLSGVGNWFGFTLQGFNSKNKLLLASLFSADTWTSAWIGLAYRIIDASGTTIVCDVVARGIFAGSNAGQRVSGFMDLPTP